MAEASQLTTAKLINFQSFALMSFQPFRLTLPSPCRQCLVNYSKRSCYSLSAAGGKLLSVRSISSHSVFACNQKPAYFKLMNVIDRFREQNYGMQYIPSMCFGQKNMFSTCVKRIVHSVDSNNDGKISTSEFMQLLLDIGGEPSDFLSESELQDALAGLFGPPIVPNKNFPEALIDTCNVEDLILKGEHRSWI